MEEAIFTENFVLTSKYLKDSSVAMCLVQCHTDLRKNTKNNRKERNIRGVRNGKHGSDGLLLLESN